MKQFLAFIVAGALVFGGVLPVSADNIETVEPVLVDEVAPEAATTTPTVEVLPEEAVMETVSTTTEVEPPYIEPEEIIVKYKENRVDLERESGLIKSEELAATEDLSVEEHIEGANIAVLATTGTESTESAIERLEDSPLVEYAEPNYARTFGSIDTTDTLRETLWALENTGQTVGSTAGLLDADIDGKEAWDLSVGSSTIVAVIDNGVLYTHEDLANQMWDGSACKTETGDTLNNCNHGYDFASSTSPDLTPLPDLRIGTSTYDGYHGTHVAGIIAAQMNNGVGVIGIAPNAKIMALKFGLDVASEVKAIDFAIQNGAKIINASYGGSEFSQAEYDAIARFRDAGGIFVAAAGNGGLDVIGDDNDTQPIYPASYDLPNIISVAATDQNDEMPTFSNFGDESVDLGAPGRNIMSTITEDGTDAAYGRLNGTSMAAPHVAGVAALIRSLYPSATASAVKNVLLGSGDELASLSGMTVSGKRLNAFNALSLLASDVTAPVISLTGEASTTVTQGNVYTELGATAVDTVDGDITATVGGDTVDTSVIATYTVTYSAADTRANQALEVIRSVSVIEAPAPEPVPESRGGGGGGGGSSRKKTPSNPTRTLFQTPGSVLGASTYSFASDLAQGNTGNSVTELQTALARLGFYQGPVTGTFGPLTAEGVRTYQRARGLPVTGMLDSATRARLNTEQPAPSSVQSQIALLLTLLSQLQALLAEAKAQGR